MKKLLIGLVAIMVQANPVFAQTYDVDITAYGPSENFFEALSGDLMAVRSASSITGFDGLEGTPLEGAIGRCFGATVFVDGQAEGQGNCIFEDPNGDKILQSWIVDTFVDGASLGTWRFVGGTGAHAGVTGRGHFSKTTVNRTGAGTNHIVGTATWPQDN